MNHYLSKNHYLLSLKFEGPNECKGPNIRGPNECIGPNVRGPNKCGAQMSEPHYLMSHRVIRVKPRLSQISKKKL